MTTKKDKKKNYDKKKKLGVWRQSWVIFAFFVKIKNFWNIQTKTVTLKQNSLIKNI